MCYTEDQTMTVEKAKQLNLDVFSFAPRDAIKRLEFAANACKDRTVILFTEVVAGFTLLKIAVGHRPQHGQIAKAMRERGK